MKAIEVYTGFYKDNGKERMYKGDYTSEGLCYKDIDAWKTDGEICYIPEVSLLKNTWVTGKNGYTKEDFIKLVGNHIPYISLDIIERLAFNFFMESEWACPEIYMDDFDFDEYLISEFKELKEIYYLNESANFIDFHFKIKEIKSLDDFVLENIHTGKIIKNASINDIYTISYDICPKCGLRLANEHYGATISRYPYACLSCDENFYKCEV